MEKKQPQVLGQVLQDMMEHSKLGQQILKHRLFEHWEALVGQELAQRLRPYKIQGKTLILSVDHPAWIQELQFLKGKLLAKIQEQFPDSDVDTLRLILARDS